jgi:hypothetical protein
MPILEAIVGSHSSNLYDAIFDVELSPENSEDEERVALLSATSRDNLPRRRSRSRPPGDRPRTPSAPRSAISPPRTPNHSRLLPRPLPSQLGQAFPSLVEPGQSAEVPTRSPLTRLFTSGLSPSSGVRLENVEEASIKKLERLLEDIKDLPVNRLKDEMKELQV